MLINWKKLKTNKWIMAIYKKNLINNKKLNWKAEMCVSAKCHKKIIKLCNYRKNINDFLF